MTGDDLDALYGIAPEGFTALRAELVTAAKKRGDKDAAKRIGAARRPTTAAWVVNALVRSADTARHRLTEFGEELRAAHAAMDGARIRELSRAQRTLVDELARVGFGAAGLPQPSAALRDDVLGTLQAAIADPDVAARLGRLTTAERWSGFGEFGVVSSAGTPPRKAKPPEPEPSVDAVTAVRERVGAARDDVETAELEHAVAVNGLAERTSTLATARRRYEKLLETLAAAEAELNTADAEHADAEQSESRASELLADAKSALAAAESDLAEILLHLA